MTHQLVEVYRLVSSWLELYKEHEVQHRIHYIGPSIPPETAATRL